jgi:hypothetical protein
MNKSGRSSAGAGRSVGISEANFTHIDAALDEALKQSFPASDPIAISFPHAVSHRPKVPAAPARPGKN